jgi:hypothetical protein
LLQLSAGLDFPLGSNALFRDSGRKSLPVCLQPGSGAALILLILLFNPTLVRLAPGSDAAIILLVLLFNPTLVRLAPGSEAAIILLILLFNPTLFG